MVVVVASIAARVWSAVGLVILLSKLEYRLDRYIKLAEGAAYAVGSECWCLGIWAWISVGGSKNATFARSRLKCDELAPYL